MKPTSVAILTILCGLIGIPSYAQGVVGVTAGFGLSEFAASNCEAAQEPCNLEFQPGFSGGLFVDYFPGSSSDYGVESGLKFTMMGGKDTEGDKERNNFSYLEIPVLARVSKAAGGVRAFVVVGPSFGLRLSAKDSDGNDLKDDLKAFDFGVAFGGGVEFTPRITVKAVFRQSVYDQLTDAGRENLGLTTALFNKYRNRTVHVLVDVTLKR